MTLKTRLEVMQEMIDIYGSDPQMQDQLLEMKESIKMDIQKLRKSGIDIMDLYKRFGSILFKSKLLTGQETIDRITRNKEDSLTDLVNEDKILQERLRKLNDPLQQQRSQLIRGKQQGIYIENKAPIAGPIPPAPIAPMAPVPIAPMAPVPIAGPIPAPIAPMAPGPIAPAPMIPARSKKKAKKAPKRASMMPMAGMVFPSHTPPLGSPRIGGHFAFGDDDVGEVMGQIFQPPQRMGPEEEKKIQQMMPPGQHLIQKSDVDTIYESVLLQPATRDKNRALSKAIDTYIRSDDPKVISQGLQAVIIGLQNFEQKEDIRKKTGATFEEPFLNPSSDYVKELIMKTMQKGSQQVKNDPIFEQNNELLRQAYIKLDARKDKKGRDALLKVLRDHAVFISSQ